MSTREPASVSEVLDRALFDDPAVRAFLGVLKAASIAVQDTEDELRSVGYTMTAKEWDVLAAVVAFGPIRPSEILRRVSLTRRPQTLSSVLDRLVSQGYVTRERHPEDTRGVLVAITDAGTAMIEQVFPHLARHVIAPFASRFTEAEIKVLGDALGTADDPGDTQ